MTGCPSPVCKRCPRALRTGCLPDTLTTYLEFYLRSSCIWQDPSDDQICKINLRPTTVGGAEDSGVAVWINDAPSGGSSPRRVPSIPEPRPAAASPRHPSHPGHGTEPPGRPSPAMAGTLSAWTRAVSLPAEEDTKRVASAQCLRCRPCNQGQALPGCLCHRELTSRLEEEPNLRGDISRTCTTLQEAQRGLGVRSPSGPFSTGASLLSAFPGSPAACGHSLPSLKQLSSLPRKSPGEAKGRGGHRFQVRAEPQAQPRLGLDVTRLSRLREASFHRGQGCRREEAVRTPQTVVSKLWAPGDGPRPASDSEGEGLSEASWGRAVLRAPCSPTRACPHLMDRGGRASEHRERPQLVRGSACWRLELRDHQEGMEKAPLAPAWAPHSG